MQHLGYQSKAVYCLMWQIARIDESATLLAERLILYYWLLLPFNININAIASLLNVSALGRCYFSLCCRDKPIAVVAPRANLLG